MLKIIGQFSMASFTPLSRAMPTSSVSPRVCRLEVLCERPVLVAADEGVDDGYAEARRCLDHPVQVAYDLGSMVGIGVQRFG